MRGSCARLFGIDPDAVEARARRARTTVVSPSTIKGRSSREVMIEDVDGYFWAFGVPADEP